jgi:hypothetical protein
MLFEFLLGALSGYFLRSAISNDRVIIREIPTEHSEHHYCETETNCVQQTIPPIVNVSTTPLGVYNNNNNNNNNIQQEYIPQTMSIK